MSEYYRGLRERIGESLLMVPAVAAVIHDADGRVLVQERPDGTFSLPAGAIEPGEQPAQAVMREVLEETGLIVRPVRLLGVFGGSDGYRVRYPNGDLVEYLVCLFACEIVSGELECADGESVSLRYHWPSDVPALGTEYPRALLRKGAKAIAYQGDRE